MQRLILFVLCIALSSCDNADNEVLWGSGTLEATKVLVSSQVTGIIRERFVDQGDQVKEGQLMFVVDTVRLALQKEQAKAGLEQVAVQRTIARQSIELAREKFKLAQKSFERILALSEKNSATQQQLDKVKVELKAAETQVETSQNQLHVLKAQQNQLQAQIKLVDQQISDAKIDAPLFATVLEVYVERGELAKPGAPMVHLADLSEMTIDVYISEINLGKVRIGQTANLEIDSFPDRQFPASVVWVSEIAEFTPKNIQTKEARADLVYAVKLRLENPEGILKIGMPADVYFQ
jgi:HlyD family secretion protein